MSHFIEQLHAAGPKAKAMGRAMASAFQEEPNFTYMLSDREAREQPLAWFFGSFVARLGLRYGEVYATREGSGGAVWMRPGAEVTPWGAVRSGLLATPLYFGLGGARRSMLLGDRVEAVRQETAPARHWYLVALGVRPEDQGQGLGGALLQPVLARADDEDLPCYLETFRERTAAFYSRFGFEIVRGDRIPGGGPPFWCMTRTPQH